MNTFERGARGIVSGLAIAATAVLVGGTLASTSALAAGTETPVVDAHTVWKYNDAGVDLGTAWAGPGYPDASWGSGLGTLGFGNGAEQTTTTKRGITQYFRTTFSTANVAQATDLRISGLVDDGAVAYLNGHQIWRVNMPTATTFSTPANAVVDGANETEWISARISKEYLLEGVNTIAVEVHNSSASSSDITFNLKLDISAAAATPTPPDTAIRTMCAIPKTQLPELSGMAMSLRHPGIIWVHNDSGDLARIFAMDATTCVVKAEIRLAGIKAVDFEDIAVGRDALGNPVIWVGDTGDNGHSRSNIKLYRFAEPTLTNQTLPVRTYTATYPDGKWNAESLLVDKSAGGQIWLVTKEAKGAFYKFAGDYETATTLRGVKVGAARSYLTDAAMAPTGMGFILRSGNVGSKYSGTPSGTLTKNVAFPTQQQGEAITYSLDGNYVYIGSEGGGNLIRIPVSLL